jgi:hypothetical protein
LIYWRNYPELRLLIFSRFEQLILNPYREGRAIH